MTLPQDYVNYTKISWVDSAGIKHPLYPASKTSTPTNPLQDADSDFTFQSLTAVGALVSGSASVVLDDEYKNIEVGMRITGPYIPNGTIVKATSNLNGITTVTMYNGDDSVTTVVSAVTPLIPGTTTDIGNTETTLTFSTPDDSLIYSEDSSYIVDNLSWLNPDVGSVVWNYKITANAAADISDIKVGMLVSHDNFPIGTIVTNVSGTTIVVSNSPIINDTQTTSPITTQEVTFISTDLQDSTTWSNYKSGTPPANQDDYQDDTYWPMDGSRYGLDPQHAQWIFLHRLCFWKNTF